MSVRCLGKKVQWAFEFARLKIREEVKFGNEQYALKLSWDCLGVGRQTTQTVG